jgi:hypothetical protein
MIRKGCGLLVTVTLFSGIAFSQAAAKRCWPPERQDCGYDSGGGPRYHYRFLSNKPTQRSPSPSGTTFSH